jgi:hypothetical protein
LEPFKLGLNVPVSPWQTVTVGTEKVSVLPTFTVSFADAVHPLISVTVTEYMTESLGEAVGEDAYALESELPGSDHI